MNLMTKVDFEKPCPGSLITSFLFKPMWTRDFQYMRTALQVTGIYSTWCYERRGSLFVTTKLKSRTSTKTDRQTNRSVLYPNTAWQRLYRSPGAAVQASREQPAMGAGKPNSSPLKEKHALLTTESSL